MHRAGHLDDAIGPEAPLLFEEAGTNIAQQREFKYGDPDAAPDDDRDHRGGQRVAFAGAEAQLQRAWNRYVTPASPGTVAHDLLTAPTTLAVIGPFSSSECRVAFPVGDRLGISQMAIASSAPGLAAPFLPTVIADALDTSISMPRTEPVAGAAMR